MDIDLRVFEFQTLASKQLCENSNQLYHSVYFALLVQQRLLHILVQVFTSLIISTTLFTPCC